MTGVISSMITPRLHHAPSVLRALDQVLSSTGFPCASNWHLFKDAQFGRDALEVAEDLLLIRPEIARRVIERLAELQGRSFNPHTEEEPGKIHHEHRALIFDGRPIDAPSAEMFWMLVRHWYADVTP